MAEVLHLDAVGAEEDFFDLGGTSLLALQLVGRLHERLRSRIEIGAVFEERTAVALTERIARTDAAAPALPPLLPGPRGETAPVSGAQRRALLFGRLHPDSIAYQFAAIFRLEGDLDETALRAALADLLERHEILRTSFEDRDGEPAQVIHDHLPPPLETIDLRGEGHGAWPRLVRERVRARVDAGEAPLVRWTLVRLGEGSWALLHVEHHLIHDGWSFAVLAGSWPRSRPGPRAAAGAACQDYARWELEAHGSEAVEPGKSTTGRALDPTRPAEFPGARPRPRRESFTGGSVRRRVDPELEGRLRALARENRVTLYMAGAGGVPRPDAALLRPRRLQVGSGMANRSDPNAERLIGMTVNTVAIRCDLGGDPNVCELLERVRGVAVDAYANADAPFEASSTRPARAAIRPARR